MATKVKKILVTGGSGFIGTHLMKALGDRGANYDIAAADPLDVDNLDLLSNIIKEMKPVAIIHLAAVSSLDETKKSPYFALQTNILGSYNVLEAARRHNVRVILASSAAVFEPHTSLYATSKKCMEIVSDLFDNLIIVRMFNVYGKGSKSVVNKFVSAIKSGRTIKVNGNTVRDYIYVEDVVKALISIADAESPERLITIGSGRGTSLKKLISMIEYSTGRESKAEYSKSIWEIQESICLNSSSYYKTTLEQGIKKVL